LLTVNFFFIFKASSRILTVPEELRRLKGEGLTEKMIEQAQPLWIAYDQYCAGNRPRVEPLLDILNTEEHLSAAASTLALSLINSPPGGTRRWAEESESSPPNKRVCAISSLRKGTLLISDPSDAAPLFVSSHLEEKKEKYQCFLKFAKELHLWERISPAVRASCLSNLERLQAAVDLNAHNNQISTEVSIPSDLEVKNYPFRSFGLDRPLSDDDPSSFFLPHVNEHSSPREPA